jgi:aryl-alcohol dehydrogenase-like predicted oxidoreductase
MSLPAKTFHLGGDLEIRRLGYGAMRITGEGIWGDPQDPENAKAVLRKLLDLGINFIDTADSYGPEVSEDLIAAALHPYPKDLVIATKAGLTRQGPGEWSPVGRPEYLKQCLEMSLRRLKVDTIDLYQLHRIDPNVPVDDQLAVFKEAQQAGKIRHFGLSEVTVAEIEHARTILPVVSVQNLYNLANRKSENVLDYCTAHGIGFIPWFPVASGELARPGGILDTLAHAKGDTTAQLALAWLLYRSPVNLPIPGTSSLAHLEENAKADSIELTEDEFKTLSDLAATAA